MTRLHFLHYSRGFSSVPRLVTVRRALSKRAF
jgi:hypothetical protein